MAILRRVAAPFRQTPVFHTFFLPKRERKYQRKRFRAAARTPRGPRSCSALSALEMQRRLQRCYCISQNEALAPLMGERFAFLAVAVIFPLRRRRERGVWRECVYRFIEKHCFQMSAVTRYHFPIFLLTKPIKCRFSTECEGASRRYAVGHFCV